MDPLELFNEEPAILSVSTPTVLTVDMIKEAVEKLRGHDSTAKEVIWTVISQLEEDLLWES